MTVVKRILAWRIGRENAYELIVSNYRGADGALQLWREEFCEMSKVKNRMGIQ